MKELKKFEEVPSRYSRMLIYGVYLLILTALLGCSQEKDSTTEILSTKAPQDTVVPPTAASLPLPVHTLKGSSVEQYRSVLDFKRRLFATMPYHFETRKCPPSEFTIGGTVYTLERNPFASGSLTLLFRTEDHSLVLKVQDPPQLDILEGFWREEAAAAVLQSFDGGLFPKFYTPEYTSKTSAFCQIRTSVSTNVGNLTLGAYIELYGLQSPKLVRQIALQAIDMLEAVHSVGLVHGDIHSGNFVVGENDDLSEKMSLSLIDFGRSTEWQNPDGTHMSLEEAALKEKQEQTDYRNSDSDFNHLLLSHFELQGLPRSRRDDLARLAEMLIFCLEGDSALFVYNPMGDRVPAYGRQMVKRKLFREFSPTLVPREFVQFYESTFSLDFAQTPEYEKYRTLFRRHLK